MVAQALLSSKNANHETPDVVLELVRQLGPIAFDPCTTPQNPTGAAEFVHPPHDGILVPWSLLGLNFINPPYGLGISKRKRRRKTSSRRRRRRRLTWQHTIGEWASKTVSEAELGAEVVWLGPGRIDTDWYRLLRDSANAKCEWHGRLTFRGARRGAPFPSVLFYFGARPWLFCHHLAAHGHVEVLRAAHAVRRAA